MIVYHASSLVIAHPDVAHSRKNVDFGPGFYLTQVLQQAARWCERFALRGAPSAISQYVLDDAAFATCNVLQFESYSAAWLDFVTQCRLGNDPGGYDLIVGGVANDKVFNTCELYFRNLIDKDAALQRLRFEQPNNQICIKNQHTLDTFLHFSGQVTP